MDLIPAPDARPDLPLAGHMSLYQFAARVAEEASCDDDGGPLTGIDPYRHLFDRVMEWRDKPPAEDSHEDCYSEDDMSRVREEISELQTDLKEARADASDQRDEVRALRHRLEDAGPAPPPSAILAAARAAIAGIRDVLPALSASTCGGPARKRHAAAISRHLGYLEAATRPAPAASEEAQQ